MSIPLATTTVSLLRAASSADTSYDPWGEGYDSNRSDSTFKPVKRGIRAVLSPTSGREAGPAEGQLVELVVKCDPVKALQTDKILDEYTQKTYDIVYVFDSPNFMGLGHTEIGLSYNSEVLS